jgi:phosphate:Na+ symporter
LLDLAGEVALLLWGLHMVQTGVQRAFGPDLNRLLRRALSRPLAGFAAGAVVTAILQSSTATGLMLTGLTAQGVVPLAAALAVMLGANVGTTLIVQVFAFDVVAVAPLLVLLGVILFRRSASGRSRDLGRVAIGLGLMLLALRLMLGMLAPLGQMAGLRPLLDMLAGQPVLGLLLAAGLTWAAHSSVAVVLLVMSLVEQGVLGLPLAFALVAGANLGSAVNPLLEGQAGDDPAARRLPVGNLLNRLFGCVLTLALLPLAATLPDGAAGRAVALFHLAFNASLAVLCLPLVRPIAAGLTRLLPAQSAPDDLGRPRYLDAALCVAPPLALAAAAREALRMADVLESMLAGAAAALAGADRRLIAEARRLDDVMDRLHSAIQAYLAGLDPEQLTAVDQQRLQEILLFVSHLEAAADVLDRNLMAGAARRLKRGLAMGEAERAEARRLLDRLIQTLRAAGAVFMTEDVRAARMLVTEKEAFRGLEAAAAEAHLAELRAGGAKAEAGALHMDALRDLKAVNAHLVAAAAYPVLAGQGGLLASRVRLDEVAPDTRMGA